VKTQLITVEIPLQPLALLQPALLAHLQQFGEPLRWAITRVEHQVAYVEAIVTVGLPMELPVELPVGWPVELPVELPVGWPVVNNRPQAIGGPTLTEEIAP
jgi:hypothetical protein